MNKKIEQFFQTLLLESNLEKTLKQQCLELYVELRKGVQSMNKESTNNEHKFKVGDEVLVDSRKHYYDEMEGVVVDIANKKYPYVVQFESLWSDQNKANFDDSELKLIENQCSNDEQNMNIQSTPDEHSMKIPREQKNKKLNLKVGDVVKCINPNYSEYNQYGNVVEIRKDYYIVEYSCFDQKVCYCNDDHLCTKIQLIEDPFILGWFAQQQNKKQSDNPYSEQSQHYSMWAYGHYSSKVKGKGEELSQSDWYYKGYIDARNNINFEENFEKHSYNFGQRKFFEHKEIYQQYNIPFQEL